MISKVWVLLLLLLLLALFLLSGSGNRYFVNMCWDFFIADAVLDMVLQSLLVTSNA